MDWSAGIDMELVVSIASLVVAIVAVLFTAWQFAVQRAHNRISIKPHLFTFVDRAKNNNKGRLTVYLINNGLGPAFVNDFKVYLDGVETPAEDALKAVYELQGSTFQFTTLGNNVAISTSQRVSLFNIEVQVEAWHDIEELERQLERLSLVVKYSCGHGKIATLDTRNS